MPASGDRPMETRMRKRTKKNHVKKYSYSRIAGNYLRIFSLPGKLLLLLIIIVLLLIMSVIFIKVIFP